MTDLEQVETFAAAVAKEYGSIDVWINNAGAMWIKPLMEMSSEEFRREIDLNLTTVFHGAKAAYPYMKAQGGGVILNASSFAALDPNAGRATYSAAKAGKVLVFLASDAAGYMNGCHVEISGGKRCVQNPQFSYQ